MGLSWSTDSSVTTRISCSKWVKPTFSKGLFTWKWETLGGEVTRLGGLTCRGGLPGLLGKVTLSAGV